MFYSNYGSILCHFWDIYCWKLSWPWNPCQRSINVIESGTIRYTAYGFLLVFYSIFDPKTEIFDFKNAVALKTGLGVRKVIENVTVR